MKTKFEVKVENSEEIFIVECERNFGTTHIKIYFKLEKNKLNFKNFIVGAYTDKTIKNVLTSVMNNRKLLEMTNPKLEKLLRTENFN